MTLIAYVKKMRLFRHVAVGLLAGCAWFAAATLTIPSPAFAQTTSTSSSSAQTTQPTDVTVQTEVVSAIQADGALRGQHITARVAKGVVTLTGTVQTQAQSERAETDAVGVSGVNGILNRLKISHPGTSAQPSGIAAQSAANQVSPESQGSPASSASVATAQPMQAQMQTSAPPPPPDTAQHPQTQQPPQAQQSSYPPQPGGPYRQPYHGNPQGPYSGQGNARPEGYNAQPGAEVPYYATPKSPVTIPAGTFLLVRLTVPLDSAQIQTGAYFQATAANDVYEGGVLAIPRGAELTGQVVEVKQGGKLSGSALMSLQLTSINLAGRIYPLTSDVWSSKGPSKTGRTAENTTGGAVLGAIIGGIIGGGGGAAVGAAAGGIGGLAASGATHGSRVYLPAETAISFRLAASATVKPVPWQEAQRLATSVRQPALVRRASPVYAAPPPYYGPYYRPYYGPYYGRYPY